MSAFYTAWREDGGPTQHASDPSPVTYDVLEGGIVFVFAALAFCFALIVPGYRGKAVSFIMHMKLGKCLLNFHMYSMYCMHHNKSHTGLVIPTCSGWCVCHVTCE